MPEGAKLSCKLFVCVLSLIVAGCGPDKYAKGRPPVYHTSGTVLLDGEPVAAALVTFQPVDEIAGKPGFAVTNDNGSFVAQTYDPGDGLTEGRHRVSIQKTEIRDKRTGKAIRILGDEPVEEVHLLPRRYSEFGKSNCEVQINPTKQNNLEPLHLTSKVARP